MSGHGWSGVPTGRAVLVGLAVLALAVAVTAGSVVAPLAAATAYLTERAGTDYAVAAALGAIAVLVAAAVFVSGRGATMRQREMPTVERPIPAPSAGEPLDETITGWRFATPVVGREARATVRKRLRAAAVETVAAADGCSRPVATRRVRDGTWTDDPVAAATLAGQPATIGTWLAALSGGRTAAAYRVGRTVDAIVARHERVGTPGTADRGGGAGG